MKANWLSKKLGDLLSVQNGYAFDSKAFGADGFPLIRIRDLKEGVTTETKFNAAFDSKYIVNAGDFLIGMDGDFTCHEWKGPPALLNQRVCRLQGFNDSLEPRFLFYGINAHLKAIEEVTGYTTVKHLSSKQILGIEMVVPPHSEQRRIVTLLDEAFADITTAKANAEKNLQNARELFESHLQATFTIQEGWTLKSFGELAEFRNGINFTKSSKGEAIKIVGVRDFQKNFWAPLDDLETIIPEGEMPTSDLIQSGDILFVRSNGNPELIGRSLLVGDLQEPITHSGFTIKARLRVTQLSPIYLCHYLKSGLLRREMIEGGNGANIKSLNQGTLSRLKIAFPDKAKQLMLVEQLEKVQAEIAELESIYRQKLTSLDDLKKSLLHQAFSGQL